MQPVDDSTLERVAILAKLAIENNAVIATAESCTAGGIAFTLTTIAGSSAWFDRAFVTYSNASKVALLGVSEKTLAAHGAVSAETAQEMVTGALDRSLATLAVAVTGIAGPGGAVPGKPVGTVYIGWAKKGQKPLVSRFQFKGDREAVRAQTIREAIDGLIRLLSND